MANRIDPAQAPCIAEYGLGLHMTQVNSAT